MAEKLSLILQEEFLRGNEGMATNDDVRAIQNDIADIRADLALLSARLTAAENRLDSHDKRLDMLEEKMQNGFYSIFMEIWELRKLIKEIDTRPQLKALEIRVAIIEKELGI